MVRQSLLSAGGAPGSGEPRLRKPPPRAAWQRITLAVAGAWGDHSGRHPPHRREPGCCGMPVVSRGTSERRQAKECAEREHTGEKENAGHGEQARIRRGRFLVCHPSPIPRRVPVRRSPRELPSNPEGFFLPVPFLTWGREQCLSHRTSRIPLHPCHVWPGRGPFWA